MLRQHGWPRCPSHGVNSCWRARRPDYNSQPPGLPRGRGKTLSVTITRSSDLPWSRIAHEFIGTDHDGVAITFLLVDAEPGRGARLHKHPYDEVIIVLEGRASLDDGAGTHDVVAGDIVVIPAGQPHAFVSTGDTRLRQIDIHAASQFETEWLV
jgi:mannose-6-phosphate isomerase-like protein (cupin superfamily)